LRLDDSSNIYLDDIIQSKYLCNLCANVALQNKVLFIFITKILLTTVIEKCKCSYIKTAVEDIDSNSAN